MLDLQASTPSGPPLSKEEFAYVTLREAILSGELVPGQILVQTEIADQLGVSPIPVRGAIQRLIAEGLITQKTHHRPRVSSISMDELEEILLIRMHLEILATREALSCLTEDDMAKLRHLSDRMQEALNAEDMPAFGALNKEFHLTIYDACPRRRLTKMIRDLWDNSDRHRSRTMFSLVPGLAARSQREHQKLLELLAAKDADGATEFMQKHKDRSRAQFLEILREEE